MKQRILRLIASLFLIACTGCSDNNTSLPTTTVEPTEDTTNKENNTPTQDENQNTTQDSQVLVAYFSRADENYGVGYIEKGNTQLIAEIIAEEMNANSFEIKRTTAYPAEYEACTEEAKKEQSENARPQLTETLDNFEDYDVIFLGYPIWWSDMPMAVYTFLESYDFSNKTIIPFCTHQGGGLSSTKQSIEKLASEATVLEGFDILGTTAQHDQETAREALTEWLTTLSIQK